MKRLSKSFGFAFNGIKECFSKEKNFQMHFVFTVLVIVGGFFFKISFNEWLIILICIGAVLAVELINTSIEQLCNIVHKEQHPGIKLIKDMAAASVLIMAISATICAVIIFLPKIISLIKPIIE